MGKQQKYSSWGRPFRLQLSTDAASGFNAPASRGRCRFDGGCELFEWSIGVRYCRAHWLQVHGRDQLPERVGQYE